MKVKNLHLLLPRTERGTWYRAVQWQFLSTPLNTAHTKSTASRFNEGNNQFEILYFAFDHTTALYEVQAMLGSPLYGVQLPNPYKAWAIVNVDVFLQEVIDLTEVANQQQIETTAQELTGDWRGYGLRSRTTPVNHPVGIAPTQELGVELFKVSGFEGFMTLSARVPTSRILAVFPETIRQGAGRSQLVFRDHVGNVVASIP